MSFFWELMILAGSVALGGGVSWAGGFMKGYHLHQERAAAARKAAEEAERDEAMWEVRVVADPDYYYKDNDGLYNKDRHTCLIVRLEREGSEPIRIKWYDVRKEETEDKVKAAVEIAQARAAYLNALDVKPVIK